MKRKPFKLPKAIWIKHDCRWKVVQVESFRDSTVMGVAEIKTRTIKILKKYKGRQLEEIFWHEVKHAMCKEYKIPIGGEWEETLCTMFERPMATFMRLNNLRFK